MKLNPPAAVREITAKLEDAGYSTWAVGGAVRDAVLGLEAGDWDLATRARPDEVRKIFRRTIPIGIEHGTVGVLASDGVLYEVTTFRRDVDTDGRHAVVEFADSIEEDVARRDFTCNALAWHALTEELRDPEGGVADMQAGVLRTVGDPARRFAEDYLRVLRALRFSGHFDWTIEAGTWNALMAATTSLQHLSAERIREELWKVMGQTRKASRTLKLYAGAGVMAALYEEVAAVVALEADDPDTPAWTVTIRAVDAVPPTRIPLRVALLLHATGMPPARIRDLRGGWRYTGYDRLSGHRAEDVMRRLKASNADTERVVRLTRYHNDLFPPDSPDRVIRHWLRHIGPDLMNDLFRMRFALWRATPERGRPTDLLERWTKARSVVRQKPPLDVGDLAIDGNDLKALGLPPGPIYGEILHALLERVIDDPDRNRRDELMAVVRERWG